MSKPTATILAAIDFSESAAEVYREAAEIAALTDAELRLLHVTERRDWHADTRARAWLSSHGLDQQEIINVLGTPWVQIVSICERVQPLLLVVGSHGMRGYQPLTTGSTTAHLLVRSPVPLLVIRYRPRAAAWERQPIGP